MCTANSHTISLLDSMLHPSSLFSRHQKSTWSMNFYKRPHRRRIPAKLSFPWEGSGHHLVHAWLLTWKYPSSHPKRRVGRLSRYSTWLQSINQAFISGSKAHKNTHKNKEERHTHPHAPTNYKLLT